MQARNLAQELDGVLAQFKTERKVEFKPNKPISLQELKFPPREYWRFFIEIDRQNPEKVYLAAITKKYQETLQKLKEKAEIERKDQEAISAAQDFLESISRYEKESGIPFLQRLLESHFRSFKEMLTSELPEEMVSFLNYCIEINKDIATELEKYSKQIDLPLGQLLKCKNGWLQFERTEPHCVEAFIKELPNIGIPDKNPPRNAKEYAAEQIKLIKKLHGNVIQGVKNIEGESSDYEFRTLGAVGFSMRINSNVSEKGISEMKERTAKLKKKFPFYDAQIPKGITGVYYSVIAKEKENLQDEEIQERITEIMSYLLEEYYGQLKKSSSPLEKLTLIIGLIRDMEQLHPFPDANCRTLCMLYFNHLLVLNGFPPSILPNANRFDGCSISELISDAIEGMKNTLKIINGEPIADITTQDIMDFLQKNGLKKEENYAKRNLLRIHIPPLLSPTSSSIASSLSPSSPLTPNSPPSPGSPQSDFKLEENYAQALSALKNYIENHQWKLSTGGSPITLKKDDHTITIKVPKTVFLQWSIINNQEKSPKEKFNEVKNVAITASKSTLSRSRLFGTRSEDTVAYLKKFEEFMTPHQMCTAFEAEQTPRLERKHS